jgi:hypothetical protein
MSGDTGAQPMQYVLYATNSATLRVLGSNGSDAPAEDMGIETGRWGLSSIEEVALCHDGVLAVRGNGPDDKKMIVAVDHNNMDDKRLIKLDAYIDMQTSGSGAQMKLSRSGCYLAVVMQKGVMVWSLNWGGYLSKSTFVGSLRDPGWSADSIMSVDFSYDDRKIVVSARGLGHSVFDVAGVSEQRNPITFDVDWGVYVENQENADRVSLFEENGDILGVNHFQSDSSGEEDFKICRWRMLDESNNNDNIRVVSEMTVELEAQWSGFVVMTRLLEAGGRYILAYKDELDRTTFITSTDQAWDNLNNTQRSGIYLEHFVDSSRGEIFEKTESDLEVCECQCNGQRLPDCPLVGHDGDFSVVHMNAHGDLVTVCKNDETMMLVMGKDGQLGGVKSEPMKGVVAATFLAVQPLEDEKKLAFMMAKQSRLGDRAQCKSMEDNVIDMIFNMSTRFMQ